MDATYRTTKYAVPLFFICLKTNYNYLVVGVYACETETKASLSEALMVIKQWNPKWEPDCWMVDYSDAEIGALEDVFPGEQQLLMVIF